MHSCENIKFPTVPPTQDSLIGAHSKFPLNSYTPNGLPPHSLTATIKSNQIFLKPKTKGPKYQTKRMIRMKPKSLFLSFLFFSSILGLTSSDSVQQKCSSALTKVMDCLQYSTGKAAEPTEACCTSTKEMRKDEPVCLCFFIQQTYEGVPAIKNLGVKVDRLLLLPTACKLTNTSVADCPKLLNLSPTSPDNAIFTNATNSSSAVTTTSSSSDTSNKDSASHGTMPKSHFGVVYSVMVAVFFSMLSIRP